MIAATLGHVDHGKSALVRALTGVDTDRLPEEKARGMSIDLGFAYRREPEGLIGFVDVPGHERFLRNMLAGVGSIDLVLLVVAADDGVMPQTREHLAIAELLGLARGAVVITKVDRVEPHRVQEVRDEVKALLAGTALAGVSCFAASPLRGDGIPALLRFLQDQLRQSVTPTHAGGPARMAIDRAFTIKGTGTVVTGTVFDGSIRPGDELVIAPAGRVVRVRRVRIHDADVPLAARGTRCAIALAGCQREHVARGHWLVSAQLERPSELLDCRVRVLPGAEQALRDRQQLHLHLGTSCVPARIVLCQASSLSPGRDGLATLRLEQPIPARRGDRFVLRDFAQGRIAGGGMVLDPFAPADRASSPRRAARLRALDQSAAHGVLAALARIEPWCVDLDWFDRVFWLPDFATHEALARAGLVVLGTDTRFAFEPLRLEDLRGQVMNTLHAAGGCSTAGEVARAVSPAMPQRSFQVLLASMEQRDMLRVSGGKLRPAGSVPMSLHDNQLWRRLHPKLLKAAHAPLRLRELAQRMALEDAELMRLVRLKVAEGVLVRVGDDRFMLRQGLPTLVRIANQVGSAQAGGRFSAAQFRDALGTGRGLAIDLLECLDQQRLTRRTGDMRHVAAGAAATAATATAASAKKARGTVQNWRRYHRFGGSGARND